ncbi:hypothetical protein ST201phi2-1p204 [Pseudomonas phage 201phi2-1]|uniref:Uncharacterized protein n=1 Tax=Pseudomonas phage 201phi2-1 TaxID=198110 RepID=B3FJ66_BP201|nr:hypothetical protein ST201phi2-1p204 [Pseudomonas phage 201phi2-1]ABY63033.1 hypothetical protein 201phi2-1p204 [Pseudomonas phage 201phi2-1]
MMHNFNPNQGLPVPCTEVDPRWFNNNLPQGNDCVPPIQLSQWMQANQPVGLMAIGLVRGMAQAAANKSPTHTFVYNLFCQNGFQNQVWQQWCQTAVDFTEFLIIVRQYNPNDAVKKAAQCVVEAAMGVAFHTYPVLQQITPNNFWAGLQGAQQMYQSMINDIRSLRSGNYNNGMPSNQWQGGPPQGNLPPINVQQHQSYSGYQNHGTQVTTQATVSNYQHTNSSYSNAPTATSGDVANSLYDVPVNEPAKPLVPKEEISSGYDYYSTPLQQESAPMQSFPQAATVEETTLPIPSNVAEVVVDPTYYQPTGFKLDINRAYDLIHNPGGIVIQPDQLVDWEITVGDDTPWPQLMDPNTYCRFLVKFPDGIVKEKFVEWTDAMNYLRHELDAELRRKAHRPNGIVVSSATPISTIGGDAMNATEVESLVKDGHLSRSAVPPVIISGVFQGSTDLEIEGQVREELSNMLEVNFNDDIPMPAVEYRSQFTHTLPLSDEAVEAINDIREAKDLGQAAQGIKALAVQGVISIRVMHALNKRLTDILNTTIADSMGLTWAIDDFCEEYLELEDFIEQKRGAAMRRVLQGTGEQVLNRALTIVATDDGGEHTATLYHVVDNYLNHQVGWDLADLTTLNLKSGKPVLISALAHPVILETLKGMITRNNKAREEFNATLRVITRDGFYLEVIKGRLIENATLLKLVR